MKRLPPQEPAPRPLPIGEGQNPGNLNAFGYPSAGDAEWKFKVKVYKKLIGQMILPTHFSFGRWMGVENPDSRN